MCHILNKLDILAINADTRKYKNEALTYDRKALKRLAEEFNVDIEETDEQQCTTDKDELIRVLKGQLAEANKSREKLEELLDQQQQVTLISSREIDNLKLQLTYVEVTKEQEVKTKDK